MNTATFVGQKRRGVPGGVAATLGLGVSLPCHHHGHRGFLQNFAQLPVVVHAFNGVRACVCALILSSVLKLRKNTVVDQPTQILFWVVLLLSAAGTFVRFDGLIPGGGVVDYLLSPVVLVVLSGAAGLCIRAAKGGKTA